MEEIVNDKTLDEKYEEWQKAFVKGKQFTSFNEVTGDVTEDYGVFYLQSRTVHNIIYKYVKDWEVRGYKKIYGRNNIVDQLIPLQRRYNTLMNEIADMTSLAAHPVLAVEDGSVDVDELAEEGLAPGKVIVYRQGSHVPGCIIPVDTHLLETLWSLAKEIKKECEEIAKSGYDILRKYDGKF